MRFALYSIICNSQNALCPQNVLLDCADAKVSAENWKCLL